MTKNRVGAIFFFFLSIFYFYQVKTIHLLLGSQYEAMTAQTFPYYLGLMGIIISALIFAFSFITIDKEDLFDIEKLKNYDFKKAFYFMLAMLFYGYTIRTLGFVISTIIFLIIGFKILKEKSLKVIILTSFGVGIGFWLILTQLLDIYIENGIIFEYFLGVQS